MWARSQAGDLAFRFKYEGQQTLVETLADQLAVAIENARLYEETRDMAVIEERNRMAREIHDTLAQGFTGIILQLEAAEQALSDNPPEVERHLNQASSLSSLLVKAWNPLFPLQ